MRKGKGFFASKKVLWRNRHALVLGSSNFYRKVGGHDDYYYQDNTEYDVVEPPEPSPDPEVPTFGGEFSSDESKNGPAQQNYPVLEPPEPYPDPEVPTFGGEFSSCESKDGPVQQNSADSRKKFQRDDECRDSTIIVDKILEESMMNISADLTERNLLKLFKQLDGRDIIDELNKLIAMLESLTEKGQGNVCITAMVRSKKK